VTGPTHIHQQEADPGDSSQPSYTSSSSYSPPKQTYPSTTYKFYEPSPTPGKGNNMEPKAPFSTVRTTYDNTYDNKSGSMNSVACSNSANVWQHDSLSSVMFRPSLLSAVHSTLCGTHLTAVRAGN
jgi:hypothetical protein